MAENTLSGLLNSMKLVEPSVMRNVDFSGDLAVARVSTCLRRLWKLAPPDLVHVPVDQHRETVAKRFEFCAGTLMGELAENAPAELQADAYWQQHTEFGILDPVVGPEDAINSPESDMRQHVYRVYNLFFRDNHRLLSAEYPHCGEYKAPNVSLLKVNSPAYGSTTVDMRFDTDVFVYPVWIDPDCHLYFATNGQQTKFCPQGETWTFVLWISQSQDVELTVKHDQGEGDGFGLVAVLVVGNFGRRPDNLDIEDVGGEGNPSERFTETAEGVSGDGWWPEADHLARGIFLRAGVSLDRCRFEVVSRETQEDIDQITALATTMDSAVSSTPYQALPGEQSLRILVIPPGDPSEDLDTSLVPAKLDEAPMFEALSYAWGNPSDKSTLSCNGHDVLVPRNLELALKRLRCKDRYRYVWADAVCINQADLSERSQQVSIMRLIYQKAEKVLVWLGEDVSGQAIPAFMTVCDIVKMWRPSGNKYYFHHYKDALDPISKEDRESLQTKVGTEQWQALKLMFEAPYFERFWIIQELALGRTAVVLWGEHQIAWELIGICSAWLLTRGWSFNIDNPIAAAYNAFLIYILPLAKHSDVSKFSKLGLSAVLGMTMGHFKSTDARDRVYALLGMPLSGHDPDRDLLISPDYGDTVRSVYVKAARRMLEVDGHLRILSAVQNGTTLDSSYPSWVPRWDQAFSTEPIALRDEVGYYANGGELFFPTEQSFTQDGEGLILRGLEVAPVEEVSELITSDRLKVASWQAGRDKRALLSILAQLTDEAKELRTTWSSGVTPFTLHGWNHPKEQAEMQGTGVSVGRTPGRYGRREFVEFLDGERARSDHLGEFLLYWRERSLWDTKRLRHGLDAAQWSDLSGQENAVELALCSLNVLLGRKVLHYGHDKFGLGPAATQAGDVIAILFGGIIPYILRPLGDGKYLLVGESFIPGLMQGEAVEAAGVWGNDGDYHDRDENGYLNLQLKYKQPDPRYQRKTGEYGIKNFELR